MNLERKRLVTTVEVPWDTEEQWPFEDSRFHCKMVGECSVEPSAPLGGMLVEDDYGQERGRSVQPFILLFDDGTTVLVCEDCAVAAVEAEDLHREVERAARQKKELEG